MIYWVLFALFEVFMVLVCIFIAKKMVANRTGPVKNIVIGKDDEKTIKEMENLSCKELITKIKMDYARKLLRGSKYPIGDIATRCGYDSFAYFSKVYKQTFSITPSMERNARDS